MSFEVTKARLIQELADAQASIRAEFGLAPRAKPATDIGGKEKPSSLAGHRSTQDKTGR